jgi:hypothetical protein
MICMTYAYENARRTDGVNVARTSHICLTNSYETLVLPSHQSFIAFGDSDRKGTQTENGVGRKPKYCKSS